MLTFEAKTSLAFDPEIDQWARRSDIRPDLERLLAKHLTSRLLVFPWTGSFTYRVTGSPTPDLLTEVERLGATHDTHDDTLVRILTWLLTVPRWKEQRQRVIHAADILKPHLVPSGNPVLARQRYIVD
jgi:hypothetical protein